MRATYLWLLQMATGVLIAVLLGIHLTISHLDDILGFFGADAAEVTSWESMMDRASQGIWVALYIALLAVGLYHGINGVRGIILESTPSAKTERIINRAFIIFGIVVFIGGAYVPIALLSS